jgi:hypothetical protein
MLERSLCDMLHTCVLCIIGDAVLVYPYVRIRGESKAVVKLVEAVAGWIPIVTGFFSLPNPSSRTRPCG